MFWHDDVSLLDSARFDLARLQGHRQITDAYLAGLAARFAGKLATFDGSIPVAALILPPDVVEVIPTP